jgi:hypothetical protein
MHSPWRINPAIHLILPRTVVSRPNPYSGSVERATDPFSRATSPTVERTTNHRMVCGFRAPGAAASCRRERPSCPFHPEFNGMVPAKARSPATTRGW